MLQKVRCIDASAKQMAQMSNWVLKRSKNFTEKAYSKNLLSSQKTWFTSKSMMQFFNIADFYDKKGEVKQSAKPVIAENLQNFGLKKDATLLDFMEFIVGVYK